MDIYQLRHLVAVIEHQSISRAAETLHVTQPAVTRSLHKLGEEVGAKLYLRVSGGVVPTPVGKMLGHHAAAILRQQERAALDIQDLLHGRATRVVIGVNDGLIRLVIPRVVERLRIDNPDIHLTVIQEGYDKIAEKVSSGELDFGVTIERLIKTQKHHLIFEEYFDDRQRLYANAKHPVCSQKQVSLEDASKLNWAVLGTESSREGFFNAYFSLKGIQNPSIVLETNSLIVLRETVRNSDAVAILPQFVLPPNALEKELTAVKVPELDLRMRVGMLLDPERTLTDSQRVVSDLLRTCFASTIS